MAQVLTNPVTVDAFLAFEGERDSRYQLIDGAIVAMAPPRVTHGTILMRLGLLLGRVLPPEWRAVGDAGIRFEHSDRDFYVADVAVTCGAQSDGSVWLERPKLIIEILSPGTESFDRFGKVANYIRHPAIEEIVLVATRHRRVDVMRRSEEWAPEVVIGSGSVRLESVGAALSLDELHAGLEL